MAKTGGFANFSLGESRNGSVLLPTHFTTASAATAKGHKFGDLVKQYATKGSKVTDENNIALTDLMDGTARAESESFGYGTRASATGDAHPLFDGSTLKMTDEEMLTLENRLNTAQDNGNVLHEMAFSIRGDWLVENGLYDPETKLLDQDKLKRAEQNIVQDLFNKGFKLPLGESEDDVVWFGVIHQDTDHLNMHLWFAKESRETRPEMMHKSGEPRGVIDFQAKKRAESQFRYELESETVKLDRNKLYEAVGEYRSNLKSDALYSLDHGAKYAPDLKKIFEALPQDLRGRWKVGNTSQLVTDEKSRMGPANRHMNALVDKLLANELHDDYQAFREASLKVDDSMTKNHGLQHQGQAKWSDTQDARLRKEIANGIYRQFNETFTESDDQDTKKFHKDKQGNFEKIRRAHGIDTQPKEKPATMQSTPANLKKINRLAKQMMQGSKEEMQRARKMAQEVEQNNHSQSVSDESLSQHI